MSRNIVIAVTNDRKREQLVYSIRAKFEEIIKYTPTISCIQERLDYIKILNNNKVIIEYKIVIVPITISIEKLRGLHPDVLNIRSLLLKLEDIKKELMFMASNPVPVHKPTYEAADWNLDETHSG